MMKDMSEKISVDFAIDILKALYGLDPYMGKISEVCDQLPDGDLKFKLTQNLGEIMGIVLSNLMVPIYRQHPSLGSASAPGSWLNSPP